MLMPALVPSGPVCRPTPHRAPAQGGGVRACLSLRLPVCLRVHATAAERLFQTEEHAHYDKDEPDWENIHGRLSQPELTEVTNVH